MDDTVLQEFSGGVLSLVLNRPEVLNAMNRDMVSELMRGLHRAEDDEAVRVVVITGSGKGFCAGADIKELSQVQKKGITLGEHLRSQFNPLILAISRLSKPVIAAVNGVAAGAGLGLALSCDLRVMSDAAYFVTSFAKIGLVPDSGLTYFLPRLIGYSRAAEQVFLSDRIQPQDALSWGLVNRVYAGDEFPTRVQELAKRIAEGPTRSYALSKRALYRGLEGTLEEALAYEAVSQDVASTTSDHMEGIAAFVEKRKPVFKGG